MTTFIFNNRVYDTVITREELDDMHIDWDCIGYLECGRDEIVVVNTPLGIFGILFENSLSRFFD